MKVKLNPNKKVVSEIKKKLKENGGFCPCSLINSEDTKCMCKAFRDQVERGEAGECHCGLYVAVQEPQEEPKGASTSENTSVKKAPSKAVSEAHTTCVTNANESFVGEIVKIKDEAKLFCGGNAIPDWVRQSELYVSRENSNGTVTIALSDSCTDYDILLKRDVVSTGVKRSFKDTECSLQRIDVRIMGVSSRIDNIRVTQKRLNIPEENIIIDYEHEGCLKTAIKAWSKPTDKEFVMVLQDDIELCDNFAECCNRIVDAHPNKIIALFQFLITSRNVARNLPSPYVSLGHGGASGQGIIMRTEWIADCLSGWETSGLKGDDTNINAWAEKTGKEIITTIPAILQHTGEHSVFMPGRILGKSDYYRKSAYKANWDNPFVTPITNIIR